jgi:polar amino acid transport system substrate-binding protein
LPFSSEAGVLPGLYVGSAALIANELGQSFEPVWSRSYFGKRSVRTTLLAGACDAYVGLPAGGEFMGQRVIVSEPLFEVSYAVAAPKSVQFRSLDDLSGKRVSVQFGSPPQSLLAERSDITLLTVREPEEAMRALAENRADAAFVWAPVAGFINHTRLGDAYQITPITGPGLFWEVAIGFARGLEPLRDRTNQAIGRIRTQLAALGAKYGWPTQPPITLAASPDAPPRIILAAQTEGEQAAQAEPPSAQPTPPEQATNAAPAAVAPGATAAADPAGGREIFNGTCAHCHGPDAVQSERKINLRLMHHRYGDRMDQVFLTTVTHGRPDKGMPNWSGVFSEQDFVKILAFLHTVQEGE